MNCKRCTPAMPTAEAGTRMGVSRGTVQRLLAVARKKTIDALVTGKAFTIETGTIPSDEEET